MKGSQEWCKLQNRLREYFLKHLEISIIYNRYSHTSIKRLTPCLYSFTRKKQLSISREIHRLAVNWLSPPGPHFKDGFLQDVQGVHSLLFTTPNTAVVDAVQPHRCGDLRARTEFNFISAYMAVVEGTTDYCSIQEREKEEDKKCAPVRSRNESALTAECPPP